MTNPTVAELLVYTGTLSPVVVTTHDLQTFYRIVAFFLEEVKVKEKE